MNHVSSDNTPFRTSPPGALVNRLIVLAGAIAMQLCLGATYAWSVFVDPLRSLLGLKQGDAQIPFALFYLAFPATTIIAGRLLERFGPRRTAVAGTLLFAFGWILASLGGHSFLFTAAGIGLCGGVGVGLAYLVPIAVGVRWYPERKGLITGVAVAGFGGGAALVGFSADGLIRLGGFSPFEAFAMLGGIFALVGTAGASAMRYPDEAVAQQSVESGIGSVIREKRFRVLYIAMITGLAAGFAVNANLTSLLPAPAGGGLAVSLFAVANAGGRLAWGALFDATSAYRVLTLNLCAQGIVLLFGIVATQVPFGSLLFPLLAGFNYGGVLVLYASTSARVWGHERVGRVYGILFSANIVASPVPVLFGYAHDLTGSFSAGLLLLAAVVAAGVALLRMERHTLHVPRPVSTLS